MNILCSCRDSSPRSINCCPQHNHNHRFGYLLKLAHEITDNRKRLRALTNHFIIAFELCKSPCLHVYHARSQIKRSSLTVKLTQSLTIVTTDCFTLNHRIFHYLIRYQKNSTFRAKTIRREVYILI